MSFLDPAEPGELRGQMRAKDLINKPLLIQPLVEDIVDGQDGKPWHYVECNVAVIGVGGIEEHAAGVRISWVRVLPQLTARMHDQPGAWVGGTPKVQQDNSVILTALADKGRKVAADLLPHVKALFGTTSTPDPTPAPEGDYPPGSEPF